MLGGSSAATCNARKVADTAGPLSVPAASAAAAARDGATSCSRPISAVGCAGRSWCGAAPGVSGGESAEIRSHELEDGGDRSGL
jgi:hypothetical protein